MIDYNFSTLNDKEFENISIDLISKDKEKRFERFKAGRDGGIDGRYCHTDGSQEIIQCKHYEKTGFSGLISSLKNKNPKDVNEIVKVQMLSPSKYIFVTSLPLSANNKKTIKELFTPYIKSDNDIYGQEDLNVLLGTNPEIEKRYYKLWISSTVVLDKLLNNAIESRSEFLLEDIKEKLKYYVVTENHDKAIDKLEESHIIIIAGEPGIGKTTLAEHMLLWYIEKDFKFYNIENSINEAESIYKRDEKQIFYFDDFLGSNYLEAFENKKDSHIVKFIERVKRDKNKRFILTSRTNIFNQSLLLSDTFKSKNIDEDEFIISIKSLKEMDKAYIVYNHIWHSNLEEKYIDEIYKDKRYKDIINHKNFSPRIIEFITDTIKIKKEDIQSIHYWTYLIKKLNNPQDIWTNTFDKQSDEFIRAIVFLVVLNGNKIEENKLRDAYNRYIKLSGLQNTSHISKEFDSIIEEVVKYFLNRTQLYGRTIEYSLFNPSIADFIINRYGNDLTKLELIYTSLQSLQSLKELQNLERRIKKPVYESIVLTLYKKLDLTTCIDTNYIIKLLYMVEFVNIWRSDISNLKRNIFFQNIINEKKDFNLINEFVTVMTFIDYEDLELNNYDFLFTLIDNASRDEVDINQIIELITHFDISDPTVNSKLKEIIEEYLKDNLESIMDDSTDYVLEKGINQDVIRLHMNNSLENLIGDINISDINLEIEKENIKSIIDLEAVENNIINELSDNEMERNNPHTNSIVDDIDTIDDLFQR